MDSLPITVPPYSQGQRVPTGITSLTLQATATDYFGQTASTTRVYTVLPNQPPSVTLTSPAEDAQIYGGQTITLAADASDDYGVEQVAFNVNGTDVGSVTTPPYSQSFSVPVGITSLTVQATAIDIYGKSTSASRTLAVLDPLTTVTGHVSDLEGNAIEGATVTLDNSGGRATITDDQGAFSFSDVATVPQGARLSVSVVDTASGQQGHSVLIPPVPAGTTDLGIIALATTATTTLPTTPSAAAKGDYTGDFLDDFFIGFADRQSRVYISNGQADFTQSAGLTLPFGAVRSGTSADLNNDGNGDILAQPIGQAGNVTLVITDGSGGIQSTTLLATGLDHEAEAMATGLDDVSSSEGFSINRIRPNSITPSVRRHVLAFLSVTGGTSLTVRFSDAFGGFTAPVTLAVDPAAQLRSLKLVDVTGDHLVDLVAIKQTSATSGSVVVYPRISGTAFGAAIESPISLRSVSATATTVDYAVGDFDADLRRDVAILGDGRVRVYRGDDTGAFVPLGDLVLPPNTIAAGIATPYGGSAVGEDLAVVVHDAASPEVKSVLLYKNNGFGGFGNFVLDLRLSYTVAGSTGDSLLLVGHVGGVSFIEDTVIVDGETVTTFLDVIR